MTFNLDIATLKPIAQAEAKDAPRPKSTALKEREPIVTDARPSPKTSTPKDNPEQTAVTDFESILRALPLTARRDTKPQPIEVPAFSFTHVAAKPTPQNLAGADSATLTDAIDYALTWPDEAFFTPEAVDFNAAADIAAPLPPELGEIKTLTQDIQNLLAELKAAAPETLAVSSQDTQAAEINPEQITALYADVLNTLEPSSNTTEAPSLESIIKTLERFTADPARLSQLSNLKPDQLSALQDSLTRALTQVQTTEDTKLLQKLAADVVTLLPAPKETAEQIKIVTDRLALPPQKESTEAPPTPQTKPEDILTKLTPLTPEAKQQTAPQAKHFAQARYDGRYEVTVDDISLAAQDTAHNPNDDAALKPLPPQKMSEPGPSRVLIAFTLDAADGLSLTTTASSNTQSAATGLPQALTQNSTATSTLLQTQTAHLPHPATQMVAATITRAVKAGEPTTIKLQLDPPELGRVEVKMSIDKDAKTRIVLSAEKPETLYLLQRDAQILDRALQNAGLDTNNNAMSFELARGNQDSGNQNPNRHNTQGHGADRKSAANDLDTIETTMTWHIDPQTGRMRYNALV